ncbi:MAG: hypothetical protein ABEH65_09880 [Halobacteriales archaeon]
MTVTLDRDRLTTAAIDQLDWAGLEWSPWRNLASIAADGERMPADPGIYRLRHPATDGLLAVVEFDQRSTSLGDQLTALASAVYGACDARTVSPTTAVDTDLVRHLVRISRQFEPTAFDVSYATPPRADRGRWFRRGLVAALIAIHRLATDRWPWPVARADPSRMVSDRLPPDLRSWRQWDRPRSSEWLGFDWTPPRQLGTIMDTTVPEAGLFRTWRPAEVEGSLRYVGIGDPQMLHRHRSVDGDDARFSITSLNGVTDASEASSGIWMELIGAHHLAVGHPPFRQFGPDDADNPLFDE